ncbi:MAG: hypothetical protein M3Q97_11355, partial [Bacteroidota bacterium]|nr:hypothetical protein [Bacteroidota bacterium]
MKRTVFSLFTFTLFFSIPVHSQTSGLIYMPANATGSLVLDPNGDGYTSQDKNGFIANDKSESEIAYVPLPIPGTEPNSDVVTGPSCGFTDFADNGSEYPVAVFLDGNNNLMFRFRLAGTANNSKGYSILVDSDQKLGALGNNKDPNYVAGNPGFEFEIVLETNFGVRLNYLDGTATAESLELLPYAQYAQKSIGYNYYASPNTGCTESYFYDFYIPFSVITTELAAKGLTVTTSTPLRMTANTVISPNGAYDGNVSDISGVDGTAYGQNLEAMWMAVMDNFTPTAATGMTTTIPDRSDPPVVTGPVAAAATSVSGTTPLAGAQTVITVYKSRAGVVSTINTVSVTAGNTSWTLSSIGGTVLQSGDSVYATATVSGLGVSVASNYVKVGSTCSQVPTVTCVSASNKGIAGNGPTGAATGTTIKIYDNTGSLAQTVTTNASNFWIWSCGGHVSNCSTSGIACVTTGPYTVTATESGKCESPAVFVAIGCTGTPTTPTISGAYQSGTSNVSGSATTGNTVYLYNNGYRVGSVVASGGAWTVYNVALASGNVLTVNATVSGQCYSLTSPNTSVTDQTLAPVVSGPILEVAGTESVSGTSVEAAGTTILLYRTGLGTPICTTTVSSTGTWSCTGLTLTAGQSVYATATA